MSKYFHGTNLENAINILEQERFIGRKGMKHHKKSYVSFSTSIAASRWFGEILFVINQFNRPLIKTEMENREWLDQNIEIIEYIYREKIVTEPLNYEFFELNGEEEYLIETELPFIDTNIESIYLFGSQPKIRNMQERILKRAMKRVIPIIHVEEPIHMDGYEYWSPLEYFIGTERVINEYIETYTKG